MLIGKRIKFEDLKDGMEVVSQLILFEDRTFAGEVLRGVVQCEQFGDKTLRTKDEGRRRVLILSRDNFWLVTEECEYDHNPDFCCPCGFAG